jgi:two-component system alkaline phosphatase synthesis response regulator PhoP
MKNESILVVDDEEDILELMAYNLIKEGYKVYKALNGSEALAILQDDVIDMAILDVMLPGISGMEICRKIRENEKTKNILVLFVTAKSGEMDELNGFLSGGDDFLTKPFSPRILTARVDALFNRLQRNRNNYNLEDFEISFDRHIIRIGEKRIPVTPREFAVLSIMIKQRNRTVDRNTILERGWGVYTNSGPRSVDIVITRIRAKIGKYGVCIRTVTGYGYQWDEELFTQNSKSTF